MMKYDHDAIATMRDNDLTWSEIAGRLGEGTTAKQVRQAHHRWTKRNPGEPEGETVAGGQVIQKWVRTEEGTIHVRMPRGADPDVSEEIWADLRDDFEEWRPRKEAPAVVQSLGDAETALAPLNIDDSHFGMQAWGEEVNGPNQDLDIITQDFNEAVDRQIALSRLYPVGEYLIPLGHDMSHVNQYGEGGKTATTKRGTVQDVDTRIAKIFRATRASAVRMIDVARSTSRPVHVVMVPGNHDPDENFKLGEVLQAWYRHDPYVRITNTPTMHKYVGFGKVALMLTHGEHYKKQKAGNPIVTFAAECPAKIWVASEGGCREILSGHFHKRMQGRYIPTFDVDEENGIVARSLPGLTARDAWHYGEGYGHRRASTLIAYHRDGHVLGQHETPNPPRRG